MSQPRSITDVTRRAIRRALIRQNVNWNGDLSEVEFLNRLYDLASLPSTDARFDSAEGDIWQHRINNDDWDVSWVYSDDRFHLADGPDEVFMQFLAESVHPVVRSDRMEATKVVSMLNELLAIDGWAIIEENSISGNAIYGPRRITQSQHAVLAARSIAKKINADYVHRQINRMTSAVETDPDLAIGTAKELIETICQTILEEPEVRVAGSSDLLPLARRAIEKLKLLPHGVPSEVKGARSIKSVLGNLSTIVQGLAELRNLYGTGHGKSGSAKGLSARHARLAVGAASTVAIFLIETHEESASLSAATEWRE